MSRLMTGHYWKVSENELSVQVSYEAENEEIIYDFFSGWTNVGEGIDPKKDKKILIFKKSFSNTTEFDKIINTLSKHNTILKEAA